MRSALIVPCLFLVSFCFNTPKALAADDSVVQVHIPVLSESGQPAKATHALRLGSADKYQVILHLNLEDIRAILLHPGDLKDAALSIKIAQAPAEKAQIFLYRLTREVASYSDVAADDFDPAPVAQATLNHGEMVALSGSLGTVLNQDLKDPAADHGFLLSLHSEGKPIELELLPAPTASGGEGEYVASLSIGITRYPNVDLFPQPIRPTPGIYTHVVAGHLSYDDQRLRLWGVCRHFWGGPVALDRIKKMGFNSIRMWGPRNAYDEQSAHDGVMVSDPGTLNNPDSLASFDKNFADAKKRGLFIWMPGFHYDPMGVMKKSVANGLLGVTADGSFLQKKFGTGEDWNAWKKAILAVTAGKGGGPMAHTVSELTYFDPRLKETYRTQVINLLNHVNPYTGKKYAEDEAVAVWELNNEEGFVRTTLGYGNNWPEYFRAELQNQWCQWLKKKYGGEDALRKAWGNLRPNESLDGNSVKFAPLLRDRLEYSAARGSDIVHFCCDVANSFNQEMRDVCRAQAPAGVGAAVVPVIFDTQSLPGAQWLYNDSLGDAVSFGNYQMTYHSSLTIPPGNFIMDDQTVLGKPTLIYETMTLRIDPFRAEFPLRTAALAGWQDWDGVFWHYWTGMGGDPDEAYQAAPMDYPGPNYSDGGLHADEDPALCAALSIAGQAFIHGAIAPAPDPVVHSIPAKDVYSYKNFLGIEMRRDTFTRGAAATFPTSDDAASPARPTVAPVPDTPTTGPVQCGSQITYDWQHGRMMIDTPTFKAYVGQPHGTYRFSDGIAVDGFSTPFVVFAMVSADGKPLTGADAAKKIFITSEFDSENTGFRLTDSGHRPGESVGWDHVWSDTFSSTILSRGHAPAISDNVKCNVWFPTQLTGHLESYDFALRKIADQRLDGNQIHRDTPGVYESVLQVDSRGAVATTPASSSPAASDPQAVGAGNPTEHPDPALAALFMPVPVVGWGEGYDAARQYVGESTLLYSSLTKPATQPAQQKSIKMTGAEGIFADPADIELFFSDEGLTRITAALSKSASKDDLTRSFTTQFGPPAQTGNQEPTWTQRQGDASLSVSLGETDGHPTVTYAVKK